MLKAEARKMFVGGVWRNIIFFVAQGQVFTIKHYSRDGRVHWSTDPHEAEWFDDEGQAFLLAETIFSDPETAHHFFTSSSTPSRISN